MTAPITVECIWRESTPYELKQAIAYAYSLALTKIGDNQRMYQVYAWRRRKSYHIGTIVAKLDAELTPAEAIRVVLTHFKLVGGHD